MINTTDKIVIDSTSIWIFGRSNEPLNQKIKDALTKHNLTKLICDTELKNFSDGETSVSINQSVYDKDIIILQSLSPPVNDNLMEVMLIADAARRAGAKKITAIIPYMGYSRQERLASQELHPEQDKNQSPIYKNVPISAKVIANMLQLNVNEVITCDIHAPAIAGFYGHNHATTSSGIPFKNIEMIPYLNKFIDFIFNLPDYQKSNNTFNKDNIIIVAPDAGGAKRADAVSKLLNVGCAVIHKNRYSDGIEMVDIYGNNVNGKDCIIIDDMTASGGTLCKAAELLKSKGAKYITAIVTHAIISKKTIENLESSKLNKLHIFDSVDNQKFLNESQKLKCTDVIADIIISKYLPYITD